VSKYTGSQGDSAISDGGGMPMGNTLSGAGISRVEYLENDLRNAIRKLNTK
jgi:hypothetical protein